MNRPRLIFWLRVSASVISLVIFVGLIGLWAKTYWRGTTIGAAVHNNEFYLTSYGGEIGGQFGARRFIKPGQGLYTREWEGEFVFPKLFGPVPDESSVFSIYGFRWATDSNLLWVAVPHWSLVLLSATLAAVPWLPWWSTRFSLRSMLIVTAVIAAVLGLVVWLTR